MGESLEMTIQPDEAARETTALAHQAGQIVPEVGMAAFDRVGLAFVIKGQMAAAPIAQAVVERVLVAVTAAPGPD